MVVVAVLVVVVLVLVVVVVVVVVVGMEEAVVVVAVVVVVVAWRYRPMAALLSTDRECRDDVASLRMFGLLPTRQTHRCPQSGAANEEGPKTIAVNGTHTPIRLRRTRPLLATTQRPRPVAASRNVRARKRSPRPRVSQRQS